jgi:hypothetical protein
MKPMLLSSLILLGGFSATSICVGDEHSDPAKSPPTAAAKPMPTQAHLGIGVVPLPPVLTSHLPEVIGKGRGVLVTEVADGSPADKAGLKVHDVLIRYDDQDLYSPEQLVKRVRNDQPGKEVELQYVRAGKILTAKLKLGEQPTQPPITRSWPGMMGRFDFPIMPFGSELLPDDQDALTNGSRWTRFESMSVSKGADGTYRVTVKHKDEQGNSIDHEYAGTRQQVLEDIKADDKLPDSQKQQLQRALEDGGTITMPNLQLPAFPNGIPWNGELFNWPDVSF